MEATRYILNVVHETQLISWQIAPFFHGLQREHQHPMVEVCLYRERLSLFGILVLF